VYTNPEDKGVKSVGVWTSQYRVYVNVSAGVVVLVTEPMREEELEMVEVKRVLFAEGQEDRGVKVGVESAVVDVVVAVADLAMVGFGPDALIVRTPDEDCDVDVLEACKYVKWEESSSVRTYSDQ
jgi:hypothetical protein